MIELFMKIQKINNAITVNSVIYYLKKFPLLKRLLKNTGYGNRDVKDIIRIIAAILDISKIVFLRIFYFCFVLIVAGLIEKDFGASFITIFIVFTILGGIINNKLLTPDANNYYMIVLFNLNAKKYMKVSLYTELIKNLFLDFIILSVIGKINNISGFTIMGLSLFTVPLRIIGEAFDISWYNKGEKYLQKRYVPNLIAIIISIGLILLIKLDIYITGIPFAILLVLSIIISIYAYKYLISVDNYKAVFKKINTLNSVMDEDIKRDDIELKEKDYSISESKVKGKHGYDFINTIFIERHRRILFRSARNYSLVIACIYIIVFALCLVSADIKEYFKDFIPTAFMFMPLVFYYINRGQIITKSMFYNSDHAMLTYNFYRKQSVILGMFKRRLKSITLINMLPGLTIGIGNMLVFFVTGESNILTYIASFIFTMSLTTFFSVHYLVLYYLIQPFTVGSPMTKWTYGVAIMITYMACYMMSDLLRISIINLSIYGIIFTVVYIFIALILVRAFAPKNFKLN